MKAFHGKASIKKKYLARVKKHYELDEIVQGVYWENGKGCAVGCTLEYDNKGESIHQRMEDELGIPRILVRLEDRIFEGLSNGQAKKFPLEFLEAIPVEADLSMVWPKFIVWVLTDKKNGVIQYARPDGKKAIQAVADTFKRLIKGEKIDVNEWLDKRRDASADAAYASASASADAAYAYAYADAASASADAAYAYAYADAAASSAADAASASASASASSAAYAYAARTKHYGKMAKKLLELLRKSPVKGETK